MLIDVQGVGDTAPFAFLLRLVAVVLRANPVIARELSAYRQIWRPHPAATGALQLNRLNALQYSDARFLQFRRAKTLRSVVRDSLNVFDFLHCFRPFVR
jgi:hypothetical protein